MGKDLFKSQYVNNGTGRDSYIYNNNGGFNAAYSPAKGLSLGTNMYVGKSQAGQRSDIYPRFGGKQINYNHDGTGRDGYISSSNGGFYPPSSVAEYSLNF